MNDETESVQNQPDYPVTTPTNFSDSTESTGHQDFSDSTQPSNDGLFPALVREWTSRWPEVEAKLRRRLAEGSFRMRRLRRRLATEYQRVANDARDERLKRRRARPGRLDARSRRWWIRVRWYAREIRKSFRRLLAAVQTFFDLIGQVLNRLFWLVALIIMRGIEVYVREIVTIARAVIRAIVDAFRKVFERYINPLLQRVADQLDAWVVAVRTSDAAAAIGLPVLLVVTLIIAKLAFNLI